MIKSSTAMHRLQTVGAFTLSVRTKIKSSVFFLRSPNFGMRSKSSGFIQCVGPSQVVYGSSLCARRKGAGGSRKNVRRWGVRAEIRRKFTNCISSQSRHMDKVATAGRVKMTFRRQLNVISADQRAAGLSRDW